MINSDLDLSNKKILNHNDEQMFENALLKNVTPRKKFYYDQSDESETSRCVLFSLPFDTIFSHVCFVSSILHSVSALMFHLPTTAIERWKIFRKF